MEELNLQVTQRAAHKLAEIFEGLKRTDAGARLEATQAMTLSHAMSDLRLTLEAELSGIEALVVSPKRLDIKKLLGDVGSLFAPGVFGALTPIARFDIEEAARCIAFERSTAAAFHLLRSTEAVLRDFYCHFVKRDRCDPLLRYPMLQGLQKHRRAKSHDPLLRNLDNIRLSFRNPTQHPDKIYDIQEAQDLWGLCVDLLNRMQKILVTDGA
jgi:hypothetical protein